MQTEPNPNVNEKDQGKKSRVDLVHGGEVVESVAPEDLVSFNDATCKHENLVREDGDSGFDDDMNTFLCANSKCNEVFILPRQ